MNYRALGIYRNMYTYLQKLGVDDVKTCNKRQMVNAVTKQNKESET